MALLLGPFVWLPIVIIVAAIWALLRAVLRTTNKHQLPAHIARSFAKRGQLVGAARWYAEVLADPHYEELRGTSIWGPRNGEALAFYSAHRDALPAEHRDLLGGLLWARGFLDLHSGPMQSCANDTPTLVALAHELVASAHQPREDSRLKRVHDAAELCAALPRLAAALREQLSPVEVIPSRRVESPIRPNRDPATEVRRAEATCCLCGKATTVRGLDAYAKVGFGTRVSYGTGSNMVSWSRYIACWDVMFCGDCLSDAAVRSSRTAEKRKMFIGAGIGMLGVIGLLLTRWGANPSAVWGGVVSASVGLAAFVYAAEHAAHGLVSRRHEFNFFRTRVEQFLDRNKGQLLSVCDLGGNKLHLYTDTIWEPSFDHLSLVVEPRVAGKPMRDQSGLEWLKA